MPVVLVEPPGPHLPARVRLIAGLRLAAATGALVLALLSRGDGVGLAVLLAVAAWRPLAAVAVGSALVAGTWRWGSTSLEALAGAQAVLGPAVRVEPARAAVASALAGAAVLLAAPIPEVGGRPHPEGTAPAPDRGVRGTGRPDAALRAPNTGVGGRWRPLWARGALDLIFASATGATVAAVVAGPAPGGAVWVRVLAGLAATTVAVVRGRVRTWWLDAAGVAAGLGAAALVASDGPTWSGVLDTGALRTGAAIAVAAGGVALTAMAAVDLRRDGGARWAGRDGRRLRSTGPQPPLR